MGKFWISIGFGQAKSNKESSGKGPKSGKNQREAAETALASVLLWRQFSSEKGTVPEFCRTKFLHRQREKALVGKGWPEKKDTAAPTGFSSLPKATSPRSSSVFFALAGPSSPTQALF
jgi:hypothetical protein